MSSHSMQDDTSKPRIFVQMVSYRDPECHPTLRDLFAQATHPERITVGLCWQYDPDEDADCFVGDYPHADQVRVLQYHIKDAQGAGWARQQAQSLWAGEEYTLQIQSHIRFEPGWDETIIGMLESLPSRKSVLTGWLPNYTPPRKIDRYKGTFHITGVNVMGEEQDVQMIHLIRRDVPESEIPDHPMLTASWVGNFMFVRSEVLKAVPFDPHIYFWGEEINYSARLWTHGYDMYHIHKPLMYHYWNRRGAKDASTYRDQRQERNRLSLMRNRHILGMGSATDPKALVDIEHYSLGTERSLSDYWKFYGVDFAKRTVEPFAKQGLWHAPHKAKQQTVPGKARLFVSIASHRDPELSPTLKDLFARAAQPDAIRVGICLQRDAKTEERCGVMTDRPQQIGVIEVDYRKSKGANWARQQALSLRKDEAYVLQIDSHMRFEPGWDDTLIDMLQRCPAEKPVLSAYLPNYNPPSNKMRYSGHVLRIRVRRLGKEQDPQLVHVTGAFATLEEKDRAGLYPSPFVVGNFIFSKGSMIDEVPIDPHFSFYGDEISYGARLWTHGYDIFQPDCRVMYHYWVRSDRLHLQDYRRTDTQASYVSWLRGRHLLGIEATNNKAATKELGRYGLGDQRPLEALWEFAGIDWENQQVMQPAQEGWWNMAAREQALKGKKKTKAKSKSGKKKSSLPRIFVQIASYRDPDCQHTVKELFAHAKHPERIFVGICWQFIAEEDQDCFEIPYPYPEQVRVHEVDARQSKGACWARHQIQKLWQGEEYTLQIDSHMRFEPGWDEILLDMWKDCKKDKAILTCYAPGFTPPRKLQNEWVYGMGADEFDKNGILLMKGRPGFAANKLPEKPIPGAFLSGCMFFGPSSLIEAVPYDPHLYFFGEEISMAVRLWTHGYDLFHPNRFAIYHDWDRKKRTTHFEDHQNWGQLNEKSYARVRHLLGVQTTEDAAVLEDIETYGLGDARSLQDYQDYSGVDFANKTFTEEAREGIFGNKKQKAAISQVVKTAKLPKIFVQIASYRDRECQWTIKDLFEKATHPDRISVGVCWQFDSKHDGDCFKVSTRPDQVKMLPYDWREGEGVCWARHQVQQLWEGEEYTLQIDSHMRFVPGWDEQMITELAACASDKPVLSCNPASYTPPNNLQLNPKPTIRRVLPFTNDGNIRGRGEYIDRVPDQPLNGAFIAAGFMFSKGKMIEEVPYDPYLYFDQEEITYAARLYTHGWDVFSSRQPFLYHYYNTKESVRPLHWRDLHAENKDRIEFLRRRGIERFDHLVGYRHTTDEKVIKDLYDYGMGNVRSLKDFEAYSGIDFKRKVASEKALRCQFIEDLDKYRDSQIHVPEIDGEKALSKPPHIVPQLNDNKKPAAKETPEEIDLALTTLDPTVRLAKSFTPKSLLLEPGDFVPFFETRDEADTRRAVEVLAGRHVLLGFIPSKDVEYGRQFFAALKQQMDAQDKLNIWQAFVTDAPVSELKKLRQAFAMEAPLWCDPDLQIIRSFGVDTQAGMPAAGYVLSRNLKILGRHQKLAPKQLATALMNDLLHALKVDAASQPEDAQVITRTAPVLIVPDALSPEFCDYCIEKFRTGPTFEGTVGAEQKTALRKDAKVRTDYVVHGDFLDELDEKLSRSLFPEIKKVFGFDVHYRELYKIGLYKGENGGFFRPHRDNFDAPLGYRRVAMTLHLNDSYHGGGLRFPEYGNQVYRPNKGAAIAFSSSTMHEALPVASGERFVLVGFFHGDQDEAYRRHYLQAKSKPLKVKDYTPTLRSYPGLKTDRAFYHDWQENQVLYNPSEDQKTATDSTCRPTIITTKSGHKPTKVFETPQAMVLDNFLPEDMYERIQQHALKADYEYINTHGKIARAWHVQDRFPMRGTKTTFYYAKGNSKKPKGEWVYPTKTDMDLFVDSLLDVQPHVQHLIGEASRDWWHVSANTWIYPPETALSLHDDGSGVYSGAYVYFLNPTWRPHWGGLLVMLDKETNRQVYDNRFKNDQGEFYKLKYFHANQLDESVMQRGLGHTIFPKGNRIVFIASDAYHMITRVNEAAGDNLRMSIAGFYNRKQK